MRYDEKKELKTVRSIPFMQRADISPSKPAKKTINHSVDTFNVCTKLQEGQLSGVFSKAKKSKIDQFYRSKNPFIPESQQMSYNFFPHQF